MTMQPEGFNSEKGGPGLGGSKEKQEGGEEETNEEEEESSEDSKRVYVDEAERKLEKKIEEEKEQGAPSRTAALKKLAREAEEGNWQEALHQEARNLDHAREGFLQWAEDGDIEKFSTWIKKDPDLRENSDFISKAVEKNEDVFIRAIPEDMKTREVCSKIMEEHGELYNFLPERMKREKKMAIKAVRGEEGVFEHLPKEYQRDPEIILEASKYDANVPFSAELPTDPKEKNELLLEMIKGNPETIKRIDKSETNKEMAIEAVRGNPEMLASLFKYQDDPEVVLEAVKEDKEALQFASDEIKAEIEERLEE